MDRARGRAPCPWFGPATRNGTPQPRARAAEPGEGERRSRPGGARGAGWGWNATQHHKGMAGMGATRGSTPLRRGRLNYHGHMHHTLCYPLGSFPVIAILALLCCAHALSWHIRHHSTSEAKGVSFRRPPNLDPCLVHYQDSRHAQQLVLEGHLAGSGHVCVKDGRAILAVGDARHG